MSEQYERTQYIPTQYGGAKRGPQTLYIDYLKATYLPLIQDIGVFTEFQVNSAMEGRLDLISNKFYRTPTLWWVIGMYNGITNPVFEVSIGRKLKIPDRNILDTVLQTSVEPSISQGVMELQ